MSEVGFDGGGDEGKGVATLLSVYPIVTRIRLAVKIVLGCVNGHFGN